MPFSEFWEITPYELSLAVKAFSERKTEEYDNLITQAYLTAAWQRSKQMPTLESVLSKKPEEKKKKKQTANDMLNEIKKLNAALGGTTY